MKILREKQYAAFAANAKMLDTLRRNEVNYVPGVFEVAKVIILSKEDFEKLSEDVSPEYPFLKDNREIMSASPGGLFRCLMVRAEGEKENMLIAQGKDTLYLGYGRDYRNVDLQGVPVERIALEEPKAYQEHAVFYHRPSHINDLNGQNPLRPVPERQTSFQVEQVVVLCDEQFRQFQETGLKDDQIFLFDYSDKMWFDPGSLCWHCVLVKGETGKEGILVDIKTVVIPDMQVKLRQGFGRAIRTETDTCVVSILDYRAAPGERYHKAVLETLPNLRLTRKIEDVEEFIRAKKGPDYFMP